jgi:uncharacterized repeat protein (TIGR01451 family)
MKAWKMNVRSLALLGFMCCLAFATQSAKAQQTFSYSDFSSTAGLKLNPSATQAGGALRLTPLAATQAGSAFYATALPLQNGFTSTFTFQFSGRTGNGGGADGIAFVVQGAPAGDMALGFYGGAIGYGDDDVNATPGAAIPNSLAIEFDTFKNAWDPSNNHVAIQSCGDGNNSQHHDGVCGAGQRGGLNPTLGLFDLSSTSISLIDGATHKAIVTYNPPCAGCQNLTVNVDGQQILAVAFDIATLGLGATANAFVGFTGATGFGVENNDVLSWSFSSQTITKPVSTSAPTTFAFSNTQGKELTHTVDFTPPAGQLIYPLHDPTTIQIQSTNTSVDFATWPQYVTGGPLAPSTLFPLVDDNTGGGSGTNGGLFVDLCFDPSLTSIPMALTPSDANCPFAPSGSTNFLGINVVADLVSKPAIVPGTASVLAHYEPNTTGTTTWSPSTINRMPNPACLVTTGSASGTPPTPPTDCDVLDIQQAISGDQTTSSGRSRGKGTFAFAFNVPMLLSTVSVNGTQLNHPPANNSADSAGLWFSAAHASLNLSFLVNPACPPGSPTCPATPSATNNYFSAAPVAGETFDVEKLADMSPVVPTTPATPPVGFNTAAVQPITFTGSLTGGQLADGQYLLQWSAVDNVGIQEQNQQLITQANGPCPGAPGSAGTQCYVTSLFSAQLNVDSTPPTITPTFTPPSTGNIFAVGAAVQVHFGCFDALSGIVTCSGTGGLIDGVAVNTAASQVGPHTFTITATDKAGNTTTQSVQYQIVGSSELLLLNLAKENVKQGSNLTYKVVVLNFGPSVADNVVVTDTLPAGTSFVSAGYGIVSCTPWGDCSDMSGSGSACSLSGNTVTCNIPTVGLVFKGFTGALVKITVNVSATPGTVLKDTATVKAVNTDPFLGDNSATARTQVCSKKGSCQDQD